MPQRRVTLVAGAREKAQEMGVNVGFLQDEDRHDRLEGAREVEVRNRDYHLLRSAGLIDEEKTELVAPAADQPEAEDDADTTRTNTRDRGPDGTKSVVHPGGAGHDGGDHGNDRVQQEIKRDQERGVQLQKERDLPSARDTELPENLKREGRAGKDQPEQPERDKRPASRQPKSKADDRPKTETPDESKGGAVRDDKATSRGQRDDKVKDALKADDKNDDKGKKE